MAKPVQFKGETHIFRSISTYEDEFIKVPAHVRIDGNQPGIITCWELSNEELAELKTNGGKIYLYVKGQEMPSIALSSIRILGEIEA